MASVKQVDFPAPTSIGRELVLQAKVSRVGNSSMSVAVTGWANAPDAGTEEVLKGVFEMVAIDAAGKPVAVHPNNVHEEISQ